MEILYFIMDNTSCSKKVIRYGDKWVDVTNVPVFSLVFYEGQYIAPPHAVAYRETGILPATNIAECFWSPTQQKWLWRGDKSDDGKQRYVSYRSWSDSLPYEC